MIRFGPYEFKLAETPDELDQVHRLNYRTFVQEIPQHQDTGSGRLVDKFHAKNTYHIALRRSRMVGMISTHDQPPFSIADRLPDPSVLSRTGVRPLEVRLLAVEPGERSSNVIPGLFYCIYHAARATGHTHFVISGVLEQQNFYSHLGFEPLGPVVGTGRASFIPMWATLDRVEGALERTMRLWSKRLERHANAGEPAAMEATGT